MITLEHVSKTYAAGVPALNDVSFFWNFFGIFFCANNLLPFCPCISVTNKSDY